EAVKDHAVAGLGFPADDALVPRIDVRQDRPARVVVGPEAAVEEALRAVPHAVPMRAADELERDRPGHRIDRQPDRAEAPAVDRAVRLVLMPGRALLGAWLLHQDMVVEEIDLAGTHQAGGDDPRRRPAREAFEGLDPPPVVGVLEELADGAVGIV